MGAVFNKHLKKMHFFDEVTEKVVSVDVAVRYYKRRERGEAIMIENVIRRGRTKVYRISHMVGD